MCDHANPYGPHLNKATLSAALMIIPLGIGVLYDRGPYRGVDGPVHHWFVAIALHATATSSADTLQPFTGGWTWVAGDTATDPSDGNADDTPWSGATSVFSSDQPIQPGQTRLGIITFDVPAKGGELDFTTQGASRTVVTRWTIPAAAQGTGLQDVRKRIALFAPK